MGQLAGGIKNAALGIFLLFYYNQVLGLSGGLAGTAIGLSVMIDAFSDPLAGSLSDHWRSKYGRRHPFLYASILPIAISFFFLFNPLVTSELGLFVWLVVFTNLSRTALSIYNVPYIALGAEISEDYDERSVLVAYRNFFAQIGGLFVYAIGFGYFFVSTPDFENGQLNPAAYPPFAVLLSLLMGGSILWAAWGTRSIIPSLPVARDGPKVSPVGSLVRALADVRVALRSRTFVWLFAGNLSMMIIAGVNVALDLYVATYFWELDSSNIFLVAIAAPVGVLLGAPFSPAVIGRWGKKVVVMFGALSWPVFQMLPVSLRLLDAFPENGHVLLVPLLVGVKFMQGATIVQGNVAVEALVADIADEHELESGMRQEGIFFAASSFSAKATSGLGSIVAGFALELISWPAGAHIKTAADIPPETLVHLGIVYGPLIASFAIVSVWCYWQLKISRDRHAAVLAQLAERRAAARLA